MRQRPMAIGTPFVCRSRLNRNGTYREFGRDRSDLGFLPVAARLRVAGRMNNPPDAANESRPSETRRTQTERTTIADTSTGGNEPMNPDRVRLSAGNSPRDHFPRRSPRASVTRMMRSTAILILIFGGIALRRRRHSRFDHLHHRQLPRPSERIYGRGHDHHERSHGRLSPCVRHLRLEYHDLRTARIIRTQPVQLIGVWRFHRHANLDERRFQRGLDNRGPGDQQPQYRMDSNHLRRP